MGVDESTPFVDRTAPSDADAFASWVAPHWSAMTGLASRLADRSDVEDVVQEALAQAWRKRERFDAQLGTPRAWLLALTADQARRTWRRGRLTPVPAGEADRTVYDDHLPDPDLRRAVLSLAGRQRLAVELFYYLSLPIAEVAQVMGCAQGTVKSTLADARARLRTALGEEFR